jgi:type I restriction enzyme R subunit
VKLIELKKGRIIYSDFEDQIGTGIEVQLGPAIPGTDMERFRRKVRQFLDGHANHITIAKLRRNEPLTATDLAELERLFINARAATADEVEALKGEGGLGLFVRSLVGLDREAAKHAFAGFLVGRKPTANANQIEFVNMIIDHLTERGVMEPRLLYESPFTDVGPLGVSSIFSEPDVQKVVDILADVRRRTAA